MKHNFTYALALVLLVCLASILPTTALADLEPKDYTGEDVYTDTVWDLSYILSDGKATVIRYNGDKTELEIPDTLDGYPVIEIGEQAFARSTLTGVVIPPGVTAIGEAAFYFSESLSHVTMPDSVALIGDNMR